jgi:3-phenylpropionate/cinnamic acid dioxygenase small subunit
MTDHGDLSGEPWAVLQARLQRLEDEREIAETLRRYCDSLDYPSIAEWTACWTEDALFVAHHEDSAGSAESWSLQGIDALLTMFRERRADPDAVRRHLVGEPRVKIDGDRATVRSRWIVLLGTPEAVRLESFGRYDDVLVRRQHGRWLLAERHAIRESP